MVANEGKHGANNLARKPGTANPGGCNSRGDVSPIEHLPSCDLATFPRGRKRVIPPSTMAGMTLPRANNTVKYTISQYLKTNRLRPSTPLQPSISLPLDRRRHVSAYGYTQAKALVYSQYGEPKDVLSLHTHSISPPTSTSITLRMLAAPINPADVNQIQGVYPSKPSMNTTRATNKPSAVAGNEGVAEVIGVGGGVKTVGKGDWVIMKRTAMGTWRTHMQVDENEVLKIDDNTDGSCYPFAIETTRYHIYAKQLIQQ